MSGNPAPSTRRPIVALAGNPNTGKTSLFNRLTGSNARVGNYAGVTVEREVGRWRLPAGEVDVLDIPGTYSLAARSSEEQVAVRAIFGLDGEARPHVVVAVVDATQLVRNLYLALQFIEADLPVVIALNLMDVARSEGDPPDPERVAYALGVPVVAVSASTGEGLGMLAREVEAVLADPRRGRARAGWRYPAALDADLATLTPLAAGSPGEARALALWSLLSIDERDELIDVPPAVRAEVVRIRTAASAAGRDLDGEIVTARYTWLDRQDFGLTRTEAPVTVSQKVDRWLLHPIVGGLFFLVVMATLFQALFSWSDPAIRAIELGFATLGGLLRDGLGPGIITDFLVDGVINGFGSVLVFLPQILLLFAILGFLEDSGYMARVAYLVDRAMKSVGLHGRAFVPMLSGYACAVPAIMATRTLERRRDRLLTMMVVPLMSCSARLPVYTLIIAALFPAGATWLGFIPVQGSMMVFMYLFSTAMALVAAAVLGRTLLRGPKVPFLLELPPYRLPRLATVFRQMLLRAKMFLTEAGTVILACTVVLWALLSFPREVPDAARYDTLRAGASDEVTAQIDAEESAERLRQSYGGRLGQAIEPAIAPLGFDWKVGIGLVGAFAAREVFVSTMGVVYGIGDDADEQSTPLRDRIRAEARPDGSPVYTPLVGLSLMVFFALSAQCMSTLAVVKRESGSWKWAAFLFVYMTVLAWVVSFGVYQGGRALGFG
jgi:ferrous iron transport protein B